MPYKDIEKKRESARKSYHNRKTPEKLERDRLAMAEKRKDPEKNKILQSRCRISKWKKEIRYWGTWQELDELFMNALCCPLCDCVMNQANNSFQKSLDHDHHSLYFRDIICKNCNNYRGKVDRNRMMVHLELYRRFNLF